MNNELVFNGFSSISEEDLFNVSGGFNVSMASMATVCAAGTVTVAKSATFIAAMKNPVVATIIIGGFAAATIVLYIQCYKKLN